MKRDIELCRQCPWFRKRLYSYDGRKLEPSEQFYSCRSERKDDYWGRYECTELKYWSRQNVRDDCVYYVEYCMREWNGNEQET